MPASSAARSRPENSSGSVTMADSSENRAREWVTVRARPVSRSMCTIAPCSVWWTPASSVSVPEMKPASRNSRRARGSSRGALRAPRMAVASSLMMSRRPSAPFSRAQNRGQERSRS